MATDTDALIAAGRLEEAAARLEAEGEHARATDLYEQLWDFAGAARAARAAGDLPRAVGNMLQVRDPARLESVLLEAERAGADVTLACAAICEGRSAWAVAARLYRAGERHDDAARCLEQAGDLLEAARIREQLGQLKPAMELYRRHLGELDDAGGAPSAAPSFELGRLLLRFGRPEEALPLLQRARDAPGSTPDLVLRAGKAVVTALSRLGYGSGARFALTLVGEEAPTSVRDCAQDPDLAPVRDGDEKILAGRYQLGRLLGSGGMGRVYLAIDRLTERRVAVKVFTAPGGARGRDAYRRFVAEARATGQLRHPHIVNLLDFHEEMGFMVLEYMEGGTLVERLRPRLDLAACRAVTLQVISGLAAAHQRGIVHRDIKPSNIFFTTAGAAKLGDFGVAHLQDAGQTQTGAFIGTLAFMSPEQIKGEPVTFATDIYALGVTLFQMLTGQLPFTHPDLVGKHLNVPAPAPSSVLPGLPRACDEAVLRCLAKDPAQRWDSLESLRRSIEQLGGEGPAPRRPAADRTAEGDDVTGRQQRRATDRRFSVESTMLDVGPLQVLETHDNQLGRPVLLLRIAPGESRAPLLELLSVAGRTGGDSLQHVLAIDRDKGQALLETPVGVQPPLPPADRADALGIAAQIGDALAPLHAAGLVHGRVAGDQISQIGDAATLSLIGALHARVTGTPLPGPADEVATVCLLLGLTAASPFPDGAALAHWAREELTRLELRLREERRREMLEQALATAPPGVSRKA